MKYNLAAMLCYVTNGWDGVPTNIYIYIYIYMLTNRLSTFVGRNSIMFIIIECHLCEAINAKTHMELVPNETLCVCVCVCFFCRASHWNYTKKYAQTSVEILVDPNLKWRWSCIPCSHAPKITSIIQVNKLPHSTHMLGDLWLNGCLQKHSALRTTHLHNIQATLISFLWIRRTNHKPMRKVITW